MQLRKPLALEQERALYQWLMRQGRSFKRQQNILLLISSALFITKISLMWWLTVILHGLIISQLSPSSSILIAFVATLIGQAGLVYLKAHYSAHVEKRIFSQFQQRLVKVLERNNLSLLRQYPTVYWQACFIDRISVISNFFTDFLNQKKLASLAPVLVMLIALSINPWVALILLVSAPLIPVFMWLTGMGAASAHREHFNAIDKLSHQFLDRLRGRRLLQLFVRQQQAVDDLEVAGKELNDRTLKVVRMAFLSGSVLDFFATVAMALVAVFVGFSLLGEIQLSGWQGPINFQQGLFLLLITPLFYTELKLLGRFYHTKSEAIGAAAEFKTVLNYESVTQHSTSLPLSWPAGKLLVDEQRVVSFNELALAAGKRVNLTGPSGVGKSLLLEALLGQQRVSLAGTEQAAPTLTAAEVNWLGQRPALNSASLRENLTLGHAISDGDIFNVLERVGLAERVSQLASGLETELGEQPPFSGGELHRLSLARALLLPRPIVLLDEPTAHLCDEQHQQLSQLLNQHLQNKTLIWVSHKSLPAEWFDEHWHIDVTGQLHVNATGGANE